MVAKQKTFHIGSVAFVRALSTQRCGIGMITKLWHRADGVPMAELELVNPAHPWGEEFEIISGLESEVNLSMIVEVWRLEEIVDG